MGTAVIASRRLTEWPGADGNGDVELIAISSIGAGSPTQVTSQLSRVDGAVVTINKAAGAGTAPKAGTGGKKATGVLTAAANPSDNDTVTLGTLSEAGAGTSKVYRFKTSIAQINDVLIGGSASASLDNLIAAVNAAAGAGTTYFTGTTEHPDIDAAAGAGDTIDFSAEAVGAKYNQLATTETGAQLSFGAATLVGGINQNVVEIGFTSAADDASPMSLMVWGKR